MQQNMSVIRLTRHFERGGGGNEDGPYFYKGFVDVFLKTSNLSGIVHQVEEVKKYEKVEAKKVVINTEKLKPSSQMSGRLIAQEKA